MELHPAWNHGQPCVDGVLWPSRGKPPIWPAWWEACCDQAQPAVIKLSLLPLQRKPFWLIFLRQRGWATQWCQSDQFSFFLTVLNSDLGGEASLGGPHWVIEMKDTEKGGTQAASPWWAMLVARPPITSWGYYLGEKELDKPAFPLCKERAFQVNFHLSTSLDQWRWGHNSWDGHHSY